ncbi:uncharacterized protein LOC8062998 [Sorghum bicolor]|uniref:uncharacterized protein LOC8062998 n=1 Tax=Sorghum bicolor TaxID=4558 RepID=UPI00081AD3B3|nr:uncharacterized protein LOC8062998 [Sorghum bicolor]|eukprot:XP_021319509.1 uncharacterized protein LOC8062998 [Sorghum bicolor]
MESAMDSRNADAAAAAAPMPLYPHALLSLPDLDRPPAIMEMWEVEAVAAALPAKKRRLRETFERLAACSPTPLPFRWEDLDTYISSLQYSVTLRHRQLRELEKSKPAPALAPAPAAMSLLPIAAAGDVGQVRVLEKPRPSPVLPVVMALPATGGDVHELRALVRSKPVQPQPPAPAPAAAAAAADTDVHVEEGRKRKACIQEAEEVRVAKRTAHKQERQAKMRSRKIQEDGAVKEKTTSPSHDSNGKELMPVPQGDDDDNGLAAEANASTDATVQVNPVTVSKVAVVLQPELPEPATARDATNRVLAAGVANSTGLQRSRPPRPVAASGAAASAAAVTVTGRDVEAASQKVQMQLAVREVERHDDPVPVVTKNIESLDGGEAKVSPRRPGHCTGNGLPITAITATDPICKIGGTLHEPPATIPKTSSNSTSQAVTVPPNYEVPDVEMEIVEPEETTLQVLEDDASMLAKKAYQTQVAIMSEEAAGKVSPLPLGCSNGHGHAQAAVAGAATAMPQVAAAAAAAAGDATVCKSSPTVTRDTPNLVQAASIPAPKSAGVPAATRERDAPAASHATRGAPPAAGSQQDASDVSPVPPRGGNGLAHAQSSRVSAGAAGTQTDSARDSAVVRQGSPAAAGAGAAPAPARRDLSATNPVPASSRREHPVPVPDAGRHVLQQQHMPKHEPVSSPQKQQEWSSKNHGGRPTSSRPVPEAQVAVAQRSWSRPGEGRGGGIAAAPAGGLRGDDNNRNNKDRYKAKRPLFCDKCGCKGHLAENCRTAKHLVALYQKAKEEREKEQKQICYRCGCTGHWSRNCRTAKHLVDLYQKDRAAKRAAGLLQKNV